MLFALTVKEIKYQLKSLIIYLFLAVIVVFYITQFNPPSVSKPIEPMDEIHFIYWKMIQDYHGGRIYDKQTYDLLSIISSTRELTEEEKKMLRSSNLVLNPQQKDILKTGIVKLNPGWIDKNGDITKVKFNVDITEFNIIVSEVDKGLGGMTYYCKNLRENLLKVENSYGITKISDPKDIMKKLYDNMKLDLNDGKVLKYTFGFGKYINLNDRDKQLIMSVMKTIQPLVIEKGSFKISDDQYKEFITQLNNIDRKLGGGTYYGDLYRETVFFRDKTYQEAKTDFEKDILTNDKLTGAYGRYFADYMGVVAGIFTVFISAFIFTRDRKYKVNELVNSRPLSSITYIMSKYLAVTVVVFALFLIPATHATLSFIKIAQFYSYNIDYLAFYKYAFGWILPTILFSNALGILLSIVFGNGIIAILIQLVVWFSSINPIVKNYSPFKAVIRFNSIGNYDFFIQHLNEIIFNRFFYIALSAVLILLASITWSWRRSSGFEGIRLFKYFKIQFQNNL